MVLHSILSIFLALQFALPSLTSGTARLEAPLAGGDGGAGQRQTVRPDTRPPKTRAGLSGTLGKSKWYLSDVQVTLTATDSGGSGLATTEYSFDGTSWETYDAPFTVSDEAANILFFRSLDNAGNTETVKKQAINIDKTPPVITGTPTPPNAHGWNRTSVAVSFSATDSLSGVGKVTKKVVLSSEGEGQSATGTASDRAGNSATATVTGINIDKTLPIINATRTTPNASGWNNDDVTASYTAFDALSGIDDAASSLEDDVVISEGRKQTVSGTAVDLAGNVATAKVLDINIDKTPPVITATRTPPNASGWNNGNVTVSYSATDRLSGIDIAASSVASDVIASQGEGQTAGGTAVDKAGNAAVTTVSGINIDKTPPKLSFTFTPQSLWPPNHKFVTVAAVIVANDNLSGVSVVLESITDNEAKDGNGNHATEEDVQAATPGTDDREFAVRAERNAKGGARVYTVTYQATDGAGNITRASNQITIR